MGEMEGYRLLMSSMKGKSEEEKRKKPLYFPSFLVVIVMHISYTLRQLEYFVAAAEAGTISEAARSLYVSESAIGAAIDQLEKQLGVRLMTRRKAHGLSLTPEGNLALHHARDLLSDAQELANSLDPSVVAGSLSVGCFPTLAAPLLTGAVSRYCREYPDVDLDVDVTSAESLLDKVEQGRLDVAVLYDYDIDTALESALLTEIRAHILLPADHPLAAAEEVSFAQVIDEPFICYNRASAWLHTRSLLNAANASPNIRFRTHDYEFTRSLVGDGHGWAVLVVRPNTDITNTGSRVVMKEITPQVPPVGIMAVWRKDRFPARTEAFVQVLRTVLTDAG